MYVLVYVDDILVASNATHLIKLLLKTVREHFAIEDLGPVHNYLGIQIEKRDGKFRLDQQKYIENVVSKFGLENAKGQETPLSLTYRTDPCGELLLTNEQYRAAIGCLLYIATNTRPDIAAAVAILSQKVSKPTTRDWTEVKRTIRYL